MMEAVWPEFCGLLQAEKRPQGKQARRRKRRTVCVVFPVKTGKSLDMEKGE